MCSSPLEPVMIEYLLPLLLQHLKTTDEILHSLSIKARIMLLALGIQNELISH